MSSVVYSVRAVQLSVHSNTVQPCPVRVLLECNLWKAIWLRSVRSFFPQLEKARELSFAPVRLSRAPFVDLLRCAARAVSIELPWHRRKKRLQHSLQSLPRVPAAASKRRRNGARVSKRRRSTTWSSSTRELTTNCSWKFRNTS